MKKWTWFWRTIVTVDEVQYISFSAVSNEDNIYSIWNDEIYISHIYFNIDFILFFKEKQNQAILFASPPLFAETTWHIYAAWRTHVWNVYLVMSWWSSVEQKPDYKSIKRSKAAGTFGMHRSKVSIPAWFHRPRRAPFPAYWFEHLETAVCDRVVCLLAARYMRGIYATVSSVHNILHFCERTSITANHAIQTR
jgi:hypothetical protein